MDPFSWSRRHFVMLPALAGLQACAHWPEQHPPRFDVQAHRGGRGLYPENTLPAFEHALRLGVSTLELDIGVTADGVVVIAHDSSLNAHLTRDEHGRYLEANGPAIRSLTYAALSRFDVGRIKADSTYARQYPDQKPVDHTPIPRLADLFDLVRAHGDTRTRFNIETKIRPDRPDETADVDTMVRALLAVIDDAGMAGRVSIQSFDWRSLRKARELAPGIPRVCLSMQQPSLNNVSGPASPLWTAGLRLEAGGSVAAMVRKSGAQVWSPFHKELNASDLAEARALGLKVIPWTINEPADLRRFVDMGVDGIITDRPDLLLSLLRDRG